MPSGPRADGRRWATARPTRAEWNESESRRPSARVAGGRCDSSSWVRMERSVGSTDSRGSHVRRLRARGARNEGAGRSGAHAVEDGEVAVPGAELRLEAQVAELAVLALGGPYQ